MPVTYDICALALSVGLGGFPRIAPTATWRSAIDSPGGQCKVGPSGLCKCAVEFITSSLHFVASGNFLMPSTGPVSDAISMYCD